MLYTNPQFTFASTKKITFCRTRTVFKLILALAKQQAAKCLRQNNRQTTAKIKSLVFGYYTQKTTK